MTYLPDPYSKEMVDKLIKEYDRRHQALVEATVIIKDFELLCLAFGKTTKQPCSEWLEKYSETGIEPGKEE